MCLTMLLSTHCVDYNIVFNGCVCTCITLFRVWKRLNRFDVFFVISQKNKWADVLMGQVQADGGDVQVVSHDCCPR